MSTQDKDIDGFNRVYETNKELVYQTALRYSGYHHYIAQEVTQDVFLKLYKHFDAFDKEYLPAWLVTTTKNTAKNYLKKHNREIPDEDIVRTSDLNFEEVSTEEAVIEKLIREESSKRTKKILDDLYEMNERWYEAVTMVYCMGKKQQDVADELGISLEVLHSVLYRARKWVRKKYTAGLDRNS